MQLNWTINCYSPQLITVAVGFGSGIAPGWPNLMAGACELTGDAGWMSCDFYTTPSIEGIRPGIVAVDSEVFASNGGTYYAVSALAYS